MRKLIQTREEFEYAIEAIKNAEYMAVDTETNGLNPFSENQLIGISVYIPDTDDGFYFPFRHGVGRIEIDYSSTNTPDKSFEEMSWQGKARKQIFTAFWYEQFCQNYPDFHSNLPIEWMEELKAVWGYQHMVFHNASFDLNFLHVDGFPAPVKAWDTMVSLHLVHEDWRGINVDAPYTYTKADASRGVCRKHQVGTWARDLDGTLKTKEQQGNRKLKWQSARIGLPRATEGEQELHRARFDMEDELATFAMQSLDHPMNDDLRYKNAPKPTRGEFVKPIKNVSEGWLRGLQRAMYVNDWEHNVFYVDADYKYWKQGWYAIHGYGVSAIEDFDTNPEIGQQVFYDMVAYGKQWDKIRSRILIDEKANMWMLPPQRVWDYAVLDVELTEGLLQWCLPIIESWDNTELHETHQAVMYEVAWQMDKTGFLIDTGEALARIEQHDERAEEIHQILNEVAQKFDMIEVFDIGGSDDFNPASPKQLRAFLNSGILGEPCTDIFPEWYPTTQQVDLKTYEGVQVDSTARAVLEDFEDHPVVKLVFELRKLLKSSNTYLKSWVDGQSPEGIVNFHMDSTGTVSGRFSSWGGAGNAQNIPDRNGYQIKKVVKPLGDEWALLAIDYGQLEARLASWIGEVLLGFGNREMTDLFINGTDMHSYASEKLEVRDVLFPNMTLQEIAVYRGEDWDKLVEEEESVEGAEKATYKRYIRQVGKTCNFGLLYSGTEYMLSKLLKIELEPAKVLVKRWRDTFPAFGDTQQYFTDKSLEYRKRPSGADGFVQYVTQPISNRHRKLGKYPELLHYYEDGIRKSFNPKEASAKKTWNNVVQGLGGYICTVSALHINRKYGDKVRWFANIHDALDGYIHRDHLDIVPDICDIMTDWDVEPELTVDVEASLTSWQDMSEVHHIDEWIETRAEKGYKEK